MKESVKTIVNGEEESSCPKGEMPCSNHNLVCPFVDLLGCEIAADETESFYSAANTNKSLSRSVNFLLELYLPNNKIKCHSREPALS